MPASCVSASTSGTGQLLCTYASTSNSLANPHACYPLPLRPLCCCCCGCRLGDARYLSQQLPAAKALYRQALQLRQLCCGPLTHGQAGPQEQLELATSLVKVADVCKVGGYRSWWARVFW